MIKMWFVDKNYSDTELKQAQADMLQMLLFVDKACREYNIKYWLDGGTLLGAKRHKGFIPWDDDLDIAIMWDDYKKLVEILKKEIIKTKYTLFYFGTKYKYWCEYLGSLDSICISHTGYKYPVRIDLIPMRTLPVTDGEIENDNEIINTAWFYITGRSSNMMKSHDKIKFISGSLQESIDNKNSFFNEYFKYLDNQPIAKEDSLITYSFDSLELRKFGIYKYDTIFPLRKIKFEGEYFFAPNKVDEYLQEHYGNYTVLPSRNKRKPVMVKYKKINNPKYVMRILKKYLDDQNKKFYLFNTSFVYKAKIFLRTLKYGGITTILEKYNAK